MARYLGKRLLYSIPVLIGVFVVSFLVIRLIPGDPVTLMLGINATPESVARIEEDLGLDEPPLEQLGTFFVKAFTLDFGESIVKQTSVREVIADRIPPSIYLILASVFVALVISVPLGIISATRRNRLGDHGIRLLTMVTFAMPTFWLALMLVQLLSLKLDLLPVSGYGEGLVGVLAR